ncbi:MAG: serine/threonine-protein kinase [Streptosporangiaceae bacterium]
MTEQNPGEPGPGEPGNAGSDGGHDEHSRPGSGAGAAADLGPGAQVAGYRLDERIGRGGMADVYRAYDSRLDRQVALKVLAPGLAADDAFRRRFIRESRAAAAVDDPHIIPVFEAGESNGVLFIAMRYVRGGDVRRLLDSSGPLPPAQAAEIISQAASALDAAHARGLVHRDVKPANMLLEAGGAVDRPGHVYLSDFGLSKTAVAISGITATGQFLGTLDYVAPEQIEGRQLDGRSDQYSLACSAFEMLCGEPPFRREQGVSVMYAHLSEAPPRLRLMRPELPAEVDVVMARALAKAPADRYASCREFAAALGAALGLAAARVVSEQPPAHPLTQIALPLVAGGGTAPDSASRDAAAAAAAPPEPSGAPAQPGRPPLTQPAGIVQPTRAGLTDPSSGAGRPRLPGGNGDLIGSARRPWWRSPAPVAGMCALVVLAGGGAYLAAGRGHGHSTAARQLTLPGCTTATATARTLAQAKSATVPLGGSPFGVAVDPNGQYSFVAGGGSVTVLRNGGALAPTVVRSFAVPGAEKGDAITRDGNFLLAAAGSGAAVINVTQAIQGVPNPVTGMLTSPKGAGAVEVLITANEKYAFVTLQSSAEMAVFNLGLGIANGFSPADFVGFVPLPKQPVGMATDGTWLYVASIQGEVSVLNMKKAETNPAHAVVSTAPAGCGAARALLSPDHKVLWVTDRQGDAVVALSAAKLRSDPTHALLARVMIGESPVGEALLRGGSRLVVADSNLNSLHGVTANLAVIDTAKALSGKPALLGYVSTGLVPRQFAIEPGGKTLLVTLQKSQELQAVSIADLP